MESNQPYKGRLKPCVKIEKAYNNNYFILQNMCDKL